tara:strand:- start:63 stop:908 length:846 start_codon:yes stop_codon:yes gene_type:complete
LETSFIKKSHPYDHWEFKENCSSNIIRIVPDRGGLITGWRCNNNEILYFDQERFKTNKSVRGGVPILFPICGSVPENKLFFFNKVFKMKQHGFARDIPWDINYRENNNDIIISLKSNDFTLQIFPFNFSIQLFVNFIKNGISLKSTIVNESNVKMPFSYGIHPYFNVKNINNINLSGLSKISINQVNSNKVTTKSQLENLPAGVDFISESNGKVVMDDNNMKLILNSKLPYRYNVIWTDPPRKMVCIEPWTSPRNSLLSGKDCIELNPESSCDIECSFLSI